MKIKKTIYIDDNLSAADAFLYAKYVVKGRFSLGELPITKNSMYSYLYSTEILKDRFELGEKIIALSSNKKEYE